MTGYRPTYAVPANKLTLHKTDENEEKTMESLNYELFLKINATPASPEWLLSLARFFAQDLIVIVPALIVMMWFWSDKRKLVINTVSTLVIAVALTATIRELYPHARPFVEGVGYQFLSHSATASFPSNHGTTIFAFAFSFLFWDRFESAAALFVIALLIAFSRVYLGVHWPMDMAGAAIVAVLSCAVTQLLWRYSGQQVLYLTESGYRLIFSHFIRRGWIRN